MKRARPIELGPLGVQGPAPSKRPTQTVRLYGAPLDDAMMARVRARLAAARKERRRT